ncbi:hypothetical protein N0V93_007703 [Gnomoniopsis smithogilvyi]|uniref:Rhodopsin domain-containing protein n=1 Tax=Gnomoniopsis smithogilvyi TaxID=1191159 RepID=A0A9W8YNM1_9PEZI|nr:hypothetical protein N0V93_007703 [Gnomoniopsis smithogilvyi]
MAGYDLIVGSIVFFMVLNTIAIALRVFVRTVLSKGAFGWDDIFLIVTYVGYILYAAFAFETIHYGFLSTENKPWYNASKGVAYNLATNDVCYIIAGTVKISVALVLYRLVERVYSTTRLILLIDIISCAIYNTMTTIILALGCMEGTPYSFNDELCKNVNYAQGASYIVWDVFHAVLPVFILWNIQISREMKAGVVGLFAIGLVAAIATMFRLQNYVEYAKPNSTMTLSHYWYTDLLCGVVEHSLSLFASSILALKPLVRLISKSWSNLSGSPGSSRESAGSEGSRGVSRRWDRAYVPLEGHELHMASMRKDNFVGDRNYSGGQWASMQTRPPRSLDNEALESRQGLISYRSR